MTVLEGLKSQLSEFSKKLAEQQSLFDYYRDRPTDQGEAGRIKTVISLESGRVGYLQKLVNDLTALPAAGLAKIESDAQFKEAQQYAIPLTVGDKDGDLPRFDSIIKQKIADAFSFVNTPINNQAGGPTPLSLGIPAVVIVGGLLGLYLLARN